MRFFINSRILIYISASCKKFIVRVYIYTEVYGSTFDLITKPLETHIIVNPQKEN